jgi:hypothetical protein
MAPAVPPVPGGPDAQAGPPDPAALLGQQAPEQGAGGGQVQDPNEMLRAVMARFRSIMADVDAISSMFPEAGGAAREAKAALSRMMNAAVSRPHGMGTEGPAPRLLG